MVVSTVTSQITHLRLMHVIFQAADLYYLYAIKIYIYIFHMFKMCWAENNQVYFVAVFNLISRTLL